MDESTFFDKYHNASGHLSLENLAALLKDVARVATKEQLYADAEDIARAFRAEGLGSWADLCNLTVEDFVEAGMRKFDAKQAHCDVNWGGHVFIEIQLVTLHSGASRRG